MGTFIFLSTTYPITTLILLCTLLAYLLHVTLRQLRQLLSPSSRCHGPPTYPVIGCLHSFYKNRYRLLDWYTDLLSESPTNTVVIRRFGARRTIVTANPENVEYMLKTNFSNFPKGKPFTDILSDFLGRGIFNVDGDMWYTLRKLASHEFTAKSLREYIVHTLKDELDDKLLPMLDSFADRNVVVDLQEVLRRLGFNVVCKVSLGIDPHCLDGDISETSPLLKAFDVASLICAQRGAAPVAAAWKIRRLLRVGTEKRLIDAVAKIHVFTTDAIREKKESSKSSGKDILSRMILAGYKEEVIRDMAISVIMAGRDTTSAAMTWLFHLLSRHPEVENAVVRETGAFKDLSRYEDLKEMRYLTACLSETMRLYPPVAWDSKHPTSDDVMPDGTSVRAGDRVTYFPYGMGRMESLWGEDRFEFKPDRWLSDRDEEGTTSGPIKNVSPYTYPVFQAGPRVCLGKELAFIQMKYVVATILERFEIRPAGSEQPVFVPLLTAHMAGGLKVYARRRKEPVELTV